MTAIQQYSAIKDSSSIVDYGRNWGDQIDGTKGWLHEGETVIISEWFIESDREAVPTLLFNDQGSGISSDGKQTAVFLEGGTPGIAYKLINEITTLDGSSNRKERRTGIILCCIK